MIFHLKNPTNFSTKTGYKPWKTTKAIWSHPVKPFGLYGLGKQVDISSTRISVFSSSGRPNFVKGLWRYNTEFIQPSQQIFWRWWLYPISEYMLSMCRAKKRRMHLSFKPERGGNTVLLHKVVHGHTQLTCKCNHWGRVSHKKYPIVCGISKLNKLVLYLTVWTWLYCLFLKQAQRKRTIKL